jgi:chaperonin cofactor prefoldin
LLQDKIQELKDKAKKEIKGVENQIDQVKKEMSALKSELYSRFGDNINLENDED